MVVWRNCSTDADVLHRGNCLAKGTRDLAAITTVLHGLTSSSGLFRVTASVEGQLITNAVNATAKTAEHPNNDHRSTANGSFLSPVATGRGPIFLCFCKSLVSKKKKKKIEKNPEICLVKALQYVCHFFLIFVTFSVLFALMVNANPINCVDFLTG